MFNWEKEFVEASLEDAVRRCIKVYGLEGTEQKAKELLVEVPIFRDRFLKTLYRLYKFGNKQ